MSKHARTWYQLLFIQVLCCMLQKWISMYLKNALAKTFFINSLSAPLFLGMEFQISYLWCKIMMSERVRFSIFLQSWISRLNIFFWRLIWKSRRISPRLRSTQQRDIVFYLRNKESFFRYCKVIKYSRGNQIQ